MKSSRLFSGACLSVLLTASALAAPSIRGDYVEIRSCDVYTGPCFANARWVSQAARPCSPGRSARVRGMESS